MDLKLKFNFNILRNKEMMENQFMFNKKILAASMAAAITTGGMISQSHANGHDSVEVTSNDIGQVLLAPVYFVENGYDTDITVTNTRTDVAVKAKVVFRSHVHSQEVLDFIIYLSPGDIWRGKVVMGEDEDAHIISDDDSMLNHKGWANEHPVDEPFKGHALTSSDSTTFGHIEVVGVYAATGSYSVGVDSQVTVEQGMSKSTLKLIFDRADEGFIGREEDAANCLPSEITTGTVSSISPCSLQIMGSVTISNKDDPNRASMRMTALTNVIKSSDFNATDAAETFIGTGFGVGGTDNIAEIEAALAGSQTSYEYESDTDARTHVLVTFPTKYRHRLGDGTACGVGNLQPDDNGNLTGYTPPFTEHGGMVFAYTSLDNSEGSIRVDKPPFSGGPDQEVAVFMDEVNYDYKMENIAESGWAYYSWIAAPGCDYAGAPAIAYSYKFRAGAVSTQTILQKAPNSK